MASRRSIPERPRVECLEPRVVLSGSSPANVIGTAMGDVARPHQVSATSALVQPRNIAPAKHGTVFGLFVSPDAQGTLAPLIVGARGDSGQALPVRHGRAFRAGVHNQSVVFTRSAQPGLLSTGVTGRDGTTGAYTSQTTLVGDINGDGKVDLADLQAFAPTYMSTTGSPNYNPAADFNHNGIINLYDAKALLRNMAPISPRIPLAVELHLAPADQAHYSHPTISGGATFFRTVTIVGRTTPGSLIIEDNHESRLPGGTQAYKFTGPAHATDAQGFFSIRAVNTEGLNNNDFLILDPFGHQVIRDFPIYWIPYATGKGVPKV
jgi:hypothetical protein